MRFRAIFKIGYVLAMPVMTLSCAAGATEVILHNFGCPPNGASPAAGVIEDSSGNLYGTASGGGARNAGLIFKLDPTGHQTVLYNFTGLADGGFPRGGVIRDSEGNFYGTTLSGGAAGWGVVFKLDARGHETVLYSFTGGADGGQPYAGVVRDAAGNLYGTTYYGGSLHYGVIFRVDSAGIETVLHSFGAGSDGYYPLAGVIRDPAGDLYGTASRGGTGNYGVVYELDAAGQFSSLYSFTGLSDGNGSSAGVIRDSAGNLYGTTVAGGNAGGGVVFKVDTAGHESVLYNFTGLADGGGPQTGVIRDAAGNLYGTTEQGGTGGAGVVYKLDTAGHETPLYSFLGGSDGGSPLAGVIRDAAGNLYGTTFSGGGGEGLVYQLDPAGHETVVYSFPPATDGSEPNAGVIRDSAGNLYGTTLRGGDADAGVVYEVAATGKSTVLYTFTGGPDGGYPYGGVVRDSSGNLYGTTSQGGSANLGVVFKVDATGHETILHNFAGGADGSTPYAGVIRDSVGNLYGTTYQGGPVNAGVVFKVSSAGVESVLHAFTGVDGASPYAGVIRDSSGNLYGTAAYGGSGAGIVYKLSAAGQLTVLHSFLNGSDGAVPRSGLTSDSAGNLYGTTFQGGATGTGVIYTVAATGVETVLYNFADGFPVAGVVRDAAGNLYGTTPANGTGGMVYKLDVNGSLTVLHTFTGGADGGGAFAGVILDAAGNLYGTTSSGGLKGTGVVFKIQP